MTKEEIVEEIAEGIYQYSSCFEEVVLNTTEYMSAICSEVRESVQEKVVSRSIDPKETKENFKELGWY
tara:strand:- start:232 stop:435 length:204 start_codon:yes stop_codon:yes gene_type:complete